MVRRSRKADRAPFWGCPRFPGCRGTRPYEAIGTVRQDELATPAAGGVPWDDPSWRRAEAGASARATYERRLARHQVRVRERRPRLLLTGLFVGVIGVAMLGQGSTMPTLGASLIFFAVASTIAGLFVKPAHVRAWRIGAGGEEHVGRVLAELEREGFRVLHDRGRPGGRDNIDHIVIGPPGVFVVETKRYPGPVRTRGRDLYLKGRRHTDFVEQVQRQIGSVERALNVTGVVGVICVVDGEFPWFHSISVAGIPVLPPRRLLDEIRSRPTSRTRDEVDELARLADRALRPAKV
jgi:hypothetical protein